MDSPESLSVKKPLPKDIDLIYYGITKKSEILSFVNETFDVSKNRPNQQFFFEEFNSSNNRRTNKDRELMVPDKEYILENQRGTSAVARVSLLTDTNGDTRGLVKDGKNSEGQREFHFFPCLPKNNFDTKLPAVVTSSETGIIRNRVVVEESKKENK